MKKKSQERNSQTLLESQEAIFQKISEVLSQSSHSTNAGELEDISLQEVGNANCESNLEEVNSLSKYDLRTHTVNKQSRNPQRRTLDLGVSKRPKLKCRKKESETNRSPSNYTESPETGGHSQESVSMLQECYEKGPTNDFPELMETCAGFELNTVNIYSDEEVEHSSEVDKSTQTDPTFIQREAPSHPRELEMGKHMDFIRAVVKLKGVLSTRKSVSDKKLRDILNKGLEGTSCTGLEEESSLGWNVPRGTIGYVFRSSDAENIFRDTVQVLLAHLEDALSESFCKIICFWKNSVYEAAVEMLNEAFDSEVGVRKVVEMFLFRIIGSILKNEEKLKNSMLESKTMFVVSFCQSTHLSFAAINYIIAELEVVKAVRPTAEQTSIAEKLSLTRLTKNSYFLLRMLELLLEFFRTKLEDGKMEDMITKKSEVQNFTVLNMWKRHWNRTEVPEKQEKGHQWKMTVSRWCVELDGVSRHCMNHVPVLSMAVERCGALLKEIFTICHPHLMRQGQKGEYLAENREAEVEDEMDL